MLPNQHEYERASQETDRCKQEQFLSHTLSLINVQLVATDVCPTAGPRI